MPGMIEMVERERKFDATARLQIPDVAGTSVVDRSEVRLTATYWDTVSRRLLRWGHTLRHRRASDGLEDRWTLAGRIGDNLATRTASSDRRGDRFRRMACPREESNLRLAV